MRGLRWLVRSQPTKFENGQVDCRFGSRGTFCQPGAAEDESDILRTEQCPTFRYEGGDMTDISQLITNYVAAWNEPDAGERRRRIHSVWTPDGTTCYRLLDARGYDAIEARVAGSWDKWLREGKHIFRPKSTVSHHNAVKFEFIMTTVPSGEVAANGLCFLLLDTEGRIKHDYQFNPSANESNELADRYLAIWNEPDPMVRRRQILDLWADDGVLISDASVSKGRAAIEARLTGMRNSRAAEGLRFLSANSTQAHHGLIKFGWKLSDRDEAVTAAWIDLLVLDERGRIKFDYQFPA
jgi:hypothetical protein